MTGVRVCNESGFARMSFPCSQVNPSVESGLSRGVGITLREVVATPLHEETHSRISLMNLTQILSEKISMIVVGKQRTLENAVMTMVMLNISVVTAITVSTVSTVLAVSAAIVYYHHRP